MKPLYTIGHSTRSIEEFIELLQESKISQLVDIRSIPGSRHNPQYGQKNLEESLTEVGISYIYMEELGGLRKSSGTPSVNDAWRNASFRNYADYMQTEAFEKGLQKLLKLSDKVVTAIMCAEAVPWRCHRSLVADALVARNKEVYEIISKTNVQPHSLTSFAVVNEGQVHYPKSALKESHK